ncbi:aspartyl/asparaginyl beta-hydroxylase domain-containing protein [Sphingomonas sp. AR_OL41]|uniref:aspartyl/asparaginyl beta-hydroxylase domain-containing protein n=1 Tax=Sphingomonas sp. AR_OL41 TaxID=3042729 RepID=UPI0024815836|nr:aspartyl/asparaginyl beta-hydroxylase domain-containing protein [Sphingomonas sp. AR_OL41]MDH7974314.1 aspartyl/asparaginyl beta-hydroxylase domain-containing protein [Sphingomonas sp. AR_OL41]
MSDAAARAIDAALAARDFAAAQALLRAAVAANPQDMAMLLKLAGVCRAAGQPEEALNAVHAALALAPLDFTALLLRASLLDRLDDPRAGEAWGQALAQRPEGALPPQLAATVAEAERRHAAWLDTRERRLVAAMAPVEQAADGDERRRIARFRSNVLRRTRPYHSEPTHFFFPELAEREFHPRARFPWLETLERATDTIAGELTALLAAQRGELVPYIQYADHVPMRQWRPLNHSPDWRAIHLWQNGRRVEANSAQCPHTMALLDTLPQPAVDGASPNAMFSLLAPGTAIPPHVGVNNARLVCHLPLIVPEGCWFRVGAETRHWRRGEAFVFDDTIEHEALNPSDKLRIVLIFDVWHPDLTEHERDAVAALIAADNPGLGARR